MTIRECVKERKQEYEYKRLQEILYDYWLSEPDEKEVDVRMYFIKADGQTQEKCIHWRNDRFFPRVPGQTLHAITLAELLSDEREEEAKITVKQAIDHLRASGVTDEQITAVMDALSWAPLGFAEELIKQHTEEVKGHGSN